MPGPLRRAAARPGLVGLVAVCVAASVLAMACANGTYPLDFFYEMHYQQSYQSHEPPRLSAPEGAVPITGRPLFGTENPIPGERVGGRGEALPPLTVHSATGTVARAMAPCCKS